MNNQLSDNNTAAAVNTEAAAFSAGLKLGSLLESIKDDYDTGDLVELLEYIKTQPHVIPAVIEYLR